MSYRRYDPPTPRLLGYDPYFDLPPDHLARMVELVVEGAKLPLKLPGGPGQPAFNPKLPLKILLLGYATGIRSSRQLEQACNENLSYLFLTRGDTPCYRVLCSFRVEQSDMIEKIFVELFALAAECGMQRLGRIAIDSTKLRADASPESIVGVKQYQAVIDELKLILAEAKKVDEKEDQNGTGQIRTGQVIETDNMRDILRRVRKNIARAHKTGDPEKSGDTPIDEIERKPLGPRMLPQIIQAIETLEEAQQSGEKHACLTDPDARMMGEGRARNICECHSFEVAVDEESGLLVAGQTSQSSTDNSRLIELVEAAKVYEPDGVASVDADSGYYSGDMVSALIAEGIDVCIPDSNTAGDLHRNQEIGTTRSKSVGSVVLTYDTAANLYRCPEGNELTARQHKKSAGQTVTTYRATRLCTGCPLAAACLSKPTAKFRSVMRSDNAEVLEAARERFKDPEHVARYNGRGMHVETVFAFLRSVLGYSRWMVRGKERVACEAKLLKTSYQLRKIHVQWANHASS